MKKTILAAALAALSTAAFADGHGVSVSGHVNYKMGDLEEFSGNEDISVGRAGTSESRFRIKASSEHDGLTYGTNQEFGILEQGDASPLRKRVNEFYVKGDFGKVSLGQGSEAGDGVTEADYSGTYLTQGDLGSWEFGGDYSTIGSKDINRDERLKYDLPKLGMVNLSASYADNDDINVAAFASGDFWKARVAIVSGEADDTDIFAGSIAFNFSGITLAFAHWNQEMGASNELDHNKVIVGYRSGPYSVSVDIQDWEDDATLENESTGLNFVYRPAKGVELYAGLRNAENVTADVDEDGFIVGGRVKF